MTRRLAALLALCPFPALAAAWTQPRDHTLLIMQVGSYSADTFFDQQGNKRKQATYSRREISPYVEYGFTDAVTIGGKVFLQQAEQGGQQNSGIGESELFVRWRTWQRGKWVVSAEQMIKLPSPDSRDDAPLLGGAWMDIGAGLNVGRDFEAWGNTHFASLDVMQRKRFGEPNDQFRAAFTAGFSVNHELQLMPQVFYTQRLGTATPGFTLSNNDDYTQMRVQLSAVYRLTPDVRVQLGAFRDVMGRNTTAGTGILGAVWKDF